MSVFSNLAVCNWVSLTTVTTLFKRKTYSSYLMATLFPLNDLPFVQDTPFWISSYLGLRSNRVQISLEMRVYWPKSVIGLQNYLLKAVPVF